MSCLVSMETRIYFVSIETTHSFHFYLPGGRGEKEEEDVGGDDCVLDTLHCLAHLGDKRNLNEVGMIESNVCRRRIPSIDFVCFHPYPNRKTAEENRSSTIVGSLP